MATTSGVVALERAGAEVPTLVVAPTGPGPRPAVVVVAEAYGVNRHMREVAGRLAAAGYAALVPDYYRGDGLTEPDDYDDFTEVLEFIGRLDFAEAALDVLAAVEHARSLADVDPDRVVVWGYCTGATLAMLATALDGRLAGAVWFFPSQPTFAELDDAHPVHPIDLVWAVRCPVLLLYGDQDGLWAGGNGEEVARRLRRSGVEHRITVYPGAGHAFSSPGGGLHHAASDAASWRDAVAFLRRVTS